jgi:hypothetical protein
LPGCRGDHRGWQRLLHSAAIEHNVRELGRKAGFTDEFADQQPG